ncbi:hypothetical protein IA759_05590 [Listeria marthii]|nr:hypothetical protein [Listeria marthii]
MASDTPDILAQLNTRAQEIAKGKGYVPPSVVEDAITNGVKTAGNQINTWKFETGDVITVIPN